MQDCRMQRSKLEVCVAIIEILARKGPQTSRKIGEAIITKGDTIRECLDLLVEQKLLGKKPNLNNVETYVTTANGKRVLEFFNLKVPLPEISKSNEH